MNILVIGFRQIYIFYKINNPSHYLLM